VTQRYSFAVLLLAIALVAFGGRTVLGRQTVRTTLDGVYTAAQAERGATVFSQRCARCHGENLDGIGAAPMLYSSRFLDRFREDALRGLFEYTAANMPLDGKPVPGGLSETEYLDVTAYLLSVNELPPGAKELTVADLAATLLVGPEGPRPLPPSTTVRVVGCLAQSAGAWTLVRASSPARVRKADTTDAVELQTSGRAPLGTLVFRLPNLSDDHPTAALTAQVQKKVQVKGVLNGQGADARVSVLSFAPLDQDCQK
jgi:S-disulfanyl-L-cysteine oxidoreductase SoxD